MQSLDLFSGRTFKQSLINSPETSLIQLKNNKLTNFDDITNISIKSIRKWQAVFKYLLK